jgi:RNA polymerase sigma-70 factor (ECF subfamily)
MTLTEQAAGMFHRHRARVFRYLRRAVGSADVAEDLSQEVFLRIVRGLPAYEERQLETAWVFRIVRRVLAEHWRRPLVPPGTERMDDHAAVRPATQMMRVSLDQAIEQLSPLNREILLMREVVGLSYEEIASALELSLAAVRNRLARARETLQATVVFERDSDRECRAKGGSREG